MILLHGGITGSSGLAGWRFMAPFLGENGFRVYAPDLPGFGLADTSPEHRPGSYAAYVDFVKEFARALCLERFHIAGNSMGCGTCVNYICNHPEDVISFALIAGPVGDVAPHVPIDDDAEKKLMAFDGSPESMRAMMAGIIYREEAVTDDLIAMRTTQALAQKESYAGIPASDLASLSTYKLCRSGLVT